MLFFARPEQNRPKIPRTWDPAAMASLLENGRRVGIRRSDRFRKRSSFGYRHHSIGDLVRYAALNQGGDEFSDYCGFVPAKLIEPAPVRYSDEQLHALSLYLYSLHPPQEHFSLFDILPVSVGTDPELALKTRRGSGYYKVPSLKGVWYRGPFEHDGSVATLEDWFDPNRVKEDYTPIGYAGLGAKERVIKGREFGLKLSPNVGNEPDRAWWVPFMARTFLHVRISR